MLSINVLVIMAVVLLTLEVMVETTRVEVNKLLAPITESLRVEVCRVSAKRVLPIMVEKIC